MFDALMLILRHAYAVTMLLLMLTLTPPPPLSSPCRWIRRQRHDISLFTTQSSPSLRFRAREFSRFSMIYVSLLCLLLIFDHAPCAFMPVHLLAYAIA